MKVRLDQLLVARGLTHDLATAEALIRSGDVYTDNRRLDKPGILLDAATIIHLKQKCRYVSRGGLKLEQGLSSFAIDVTGSTCVDIGASTGGFTDCLLQHGATHVYAVDVAYGQLAWKLRQDPRVTVIERFNARTITLDDLSNSAIDLVVMDASFISITVLLPSIFDLFTNRPIQILTLIKPQFELERNEIGPGGVVTDPQLHCKAINKIATFVINAGLVHHGAIPSPILGPKGNKEFLMHITGKDYKMD